MFVSFRTLWDEDETLREEKWRGQAERTERNWKTGKETKQDEVRINAVVAISFWEKMA